MLRRFTARGRATAHILASAWQRPSRALAPGVVVSQRFIATSTAPNSHDTATCSIEASTATSIPGHTASRAEAECAVLPAFVSKADPLAKSRIMNFAKRCAPNAASPAASARGTLPRNKATKPSAQSKSAAASSARPVEIACQQLSSGELTQWLRGTAGATLNVATASVPFIEEGGSWFVAVCAVNVGAKFFTDAPLGPKTSFVISAATVSVDVSGNSEPLGSPSLGVDGVTKWTAPEAESGKLFGYGAARSQNDAELAAAAHCEQRIDALGVQLFQLSSMQIKHAQSVDQKSQGSSGALQKATSGGGTKHRIAGVKQGAEVYAMHVPLAPLPPGHREFKKRLEAIAASPRPPPVIVSPSATAAVAALHSGMAKTLQTKSQAPVAGSSARSITQTKPASPASSPTRPITSKNAAPPVQPNARPAVAQSVKEKLAQMQRQERAAETQAKETAAALDAAMKAGPSMDIASELIASEELLASQRFDTHSSSPMTKDNGTFAFTSVEETASMSGHSEAEWLSEDAVEVMGTDSEDATPGHGQDSSSSSQRRFRLQSVHTKQDSHLAKQLFHQMGPAAEAAAAAARVLAQRIDNDHEGEVVADRNLDWRLRPMHGLLSSERKRFALRGSVAASAAQEEQKHHNSGISSDGGDGSAAEPSNIPSSSTAHQQHLKRTSKYGFNTARIEEEAQQQSLSLHPSKKPYDESEAGRYWLVELGATYWSPPDAMLSPHVMCLVSIGRVTHFAKTNPGVLPAPSASSLFDALPAEFSYVGRDSLTTVAVQNDFSASPYLSLFSELVTETVFVPQPLYRHACPRGAAQRRVSVELRLPNGFVRPANAPPIRDLPPDVVEQLEHYQNAMVAATSSSNSSSLGHESNNDDLPQLVFTAVGIARDRDTALHMCAMHCELLIDACGLRLLLSDKGQADHALECRNLGRWAVEANPSTLFDHSGGAQRAAGGASGTNRCASTKPLESIPWPRPLREWCESDGVTTQTGAGVAVGSRKAMQRRRAAVLSDEELFLSRHHQIVRVLRSHVTECNPDTITVADLRERYDGSTPSRSNNASEQPEKDTLVVNDAEEQTQIQSSLSSASFSSDGGSSCGADACTTGDEGRVVSAETSSLPATTSTALPATASAASLDSVEDHDDDVMIAALRSFNKHHAPPGFPELHFLCLLYSDQWRCTTLLPLPVEVYGLRGGYSIGLTPQRAMALCAWHAVDTICHFGLECFPDDPAMQAAFDEMRRQRRMTGCNTRRVISASKSSGAKTLEPTRSNAPEALVVDEIETLEKTKECGSVTGKAEETSKTATDESGSQAPRQLPTPAVHSRSPPTLRSVHTGAITIAKDPASVTHIDTILHVDAFAFDVVATDEEDVVFLRDTVCAFGASVQLQRTLKALARFEHELRLHPPTHSSVSTPEPLAKQDEARKLELQQKSDPALRTVRTPQTTSSTVAKTQASVVAVAETNKSEKTKVREGVQVVGGRRVPPTLKLSPVSPAPTTASKTRAPPAVVRALAKVHTSGDGGLAALSHAVAGLIKGSYPHAFDKAQCCLTTHAAKIEAVLKRLCAGKKQEASRRRAGESAPVVTSSPSTGVSTAATSSTNERSVSNSMAALTSAASSLPPSWHYYGHQSVHQRFSCPCNSLWMELYLPGKNMTVVALGRGATRKSAERAVLIHALRLITWSQDKCYSSTGLMPSSIADEPVEQSPPESESDASIGKAGEAATSWLQQALRSPVVTEAFATVTAKQSSVDLKMSSDRDQHLGPAILRPDTDADAGDRDASRCSLKPNAPGKSPAESSNNGCGADSGSNGSSKVLMPRPVMDTVMAKRCSLVKPRRK